MSDDASSDVSELERAVEEARKKRNLMTDLACAWTVLTIIMWHHVANGFQSMLTGGIAFAGVAFMYWMLANSASDEYVSVAENLSQHSK